MTTTPAAPRFPYAVLAPVALTAAALVWGFWTAIGELVQTWNTNSNYSYGFLVPPFAAFLLWLRRDKLDISALKPSAWGFALIALGLAIRLTSTYLYYLTIDPMAIIPCLAGIVLLFGGRAAWRWAWPAVLFMAFMIPLPYTVATAMSEPLQRLATITSTFVMQTLGLPALSEGNVILLNEHRIGVVEACSGLRMLLVFFALATAVVLVTQRHWMDRLLIIFSAIPIAIASNIIRITTTGIMYNMGQSELAQHFFHDVAGWLMMPLALSMLWVELKILQHLFIDAPSAPAKTTKAVPASRRDSAVPKPAVPRGNRRNARAKQPVTPVQVEEPAEKV